MIKRITTSDDLKIVHENFAELAGTHPVKHYGGLPFLPDVILAAWSNDNLLTNSCVLVCNFTGERKIDALCWFVISPDFRVNKSIAVSYLWVSKTNKSGLKVFLEALRILKRKRVDVINVGFLTQSSSAPRIEKLLQKMGFVPEDKSYSLVLKEEAPL